MNLLVFVVKFLIINRVVGQYENRRYEGSQVWQIGLKDQEVLNKIQELAGGNEVSLWGSGLGRADVLVMPQYLQTISEVLKADNITYTVSIDDLQKVIDEENPVHKVSRSTLPGQRFNLTWDMYYSLHEIYSFLEYVAEANPYLCSLATIGETYEKRPLKLLKISNNRRGNKAILIDGGIHAREWISPATVLYIINELVWNFNSQPSSMQNIDWYIIPVINPDGYDYTTTTDRLWRKNRQPVGSRNKNCFGVDLNRNFGVQWGVSGSSSNPCSDTFKGRRAFSEKESQALRDFMLTTRVDWQGYLSFHSYGQFILIPYGYDFVKPADYGDLENVGKQMVSAISRVDGTVFTTGNTAEMLYASAGGSDDWAKAHGKVKYSYTIELMDTGRYGFVLPAQFILKGAKHGLAAVQTLARVIHSGGLIKQFFPKYF